MRIIIPAAGEGSRFKEAGYKLPKPFIDVNGLPMIRKVINSLPAEFPIHIVGLAEHQEYWENVDWGLRKESPINISLLEEKTRGAAETVLSVAYNMHPSDPILVVNVDNLVDLDLNLGFVRKLDPGCHGILTMPASGLKWSYVSHSDEGYVDLVREKQPISSWGTCGFYYFRSAYDYCWAAITMINRLEKEKGEFYLAPVYNYLIDKGDKVQSVGILSERFHSLGTPEDLREYLEKTKP